jgi:hypothetical protein
LVRESDSDGIRGEHSAQVRPASLIGTAFWQILQVLLTPAAPPQHPEKSGVGQMLDLR